MHFKHLRRNGAAVVAAAFTGILIIGGTAFAVTSFDTDTLGHGDCSGVGWGDSEYFAGVYGGTSKGPSGTCHMKLDVYVIYSAGIMDPPQTPSWETYNRVAGAGPGGASGDYVDSLHWLSSDGGTSSDSGHTTAYD